MIFEEMHVDPPYREALRACGLGRVNLALEAVEGRVAAWSRTTDTLHVANPHGGPGFYLKRYRYPTWRKRLRGCLRGTLFGRHRAHREYRLLDQMRTLSLPTVRPVAHGARRRLGTVVACFLITEEVPGAENLTAFAARLSGGRRALAARDARLIGVRLARQVARMHDAGFAHGQLYWRNLLIRFDPVDQPEFFFLDPRPRRGRRRVGRALNWWLDELAQLTASSMPFTDLRDRLCFLREYCRMRRISTDTEQLFREVERLARRWQRRENQRIRMSERFAAWNRRLEEELALEYATAAPAVSAPQAGSQKYGSQSGGTLRGAAP
jgi:hypothetical protein